MRKVSRLARERFMNWATIQQLIRILLYSGGSMVFGVDIADGELFQGLIAGAISIGAFAWWVVAERAKKIT